MSYEIKCNDCKQPITHICNEEFKKAVKDFLSWVPEGMWSSPEMAEAFEKESKNQGDEDDFSKHPFFGSQAWSYLIWYKEDARSFHGVIHNMLRAAGIDPYQLELEIHQEREQKEKERKELEERRNEIRRRKQSTKL